MANDTMIAVGEKLGIEQNQDAEKQTRVREEKNVKTMGVTDARKEVLKLRKEKKSLSDELEKTKKAVKPSDAKLVAMLGQVPGTVFDLASIKFGAHWRLMEQEKILWGEALDKILQRYMPDFEKDNPELTALILVSIITVVPRASINIQMRFFAKKEVPSEEKKPEEKKTDAGKQKK
uniref:Uncharacterized protein n=1 Tax=viral metagenome TaxID=1070528 RepID=A0A6H1Z5V4_9ZZZZ